MNSKWLKQNALIVGFVAGFLILLGGVIWLQQVASENRTSVDAALDEQMSQLQHLLQEKPGPSHENIEIIKKDREQVDHLYGQLLTTVGHGVEPPPDLRPVGFLQLMASTFSHLHQAAEAGNVKIVDSFAFGFGHYAGPPATLPAKGLSSEDTKRILGLLVKQLRAIDQVSSLLIDSHVDEINQIRRSEVEPTGGTETFDAAITSGPNSLYEVLPFEFQFTCSSGSLRAFLNSLTKADLFFAVRRVLVAGQAPSSEKASATGVPSAVVAASAASQRERLSVTVRIDLIEFPKKQPDKKDAGKPGA